MKIQTMFNEYVLFGVYVKEWAIRPTENILKSCATNFKWTWYGFGIVVFNKTMFCFGRGCI